ncbi:class I SAM-dependent methyltransferase [Sorangium sp. So ce296]|uniref:class I SAM-dependent methyltransferase n=1 Tax=Sorangium sp. So ce296 TaxID=3133296 RepID=UPI003F5EF385
MGAPTTSATFDRAYQAPVTWWGDIRIPGELEALVRSERPRTSLELGCGLGRLARYMAQRGVRATGVDFSPVAVAKARERVAKDEVRPEFLVGDVTHLDMLTGPFDVSYDVGCFHCLDGAGQRAYVAEVARLLRPGGTHLIWALDRSPSGLALSPAAVERVFAPQLRLKDARTSRRRLLSAHWYWLVRSEG